jgi:hypothetical protein
VQGDPVNFNDSVGLNRLMCDIYDDEGRCAGGRWGGGGYAGGGVIAGTNGFYGEDGQWMPQEGTYEGTPPYGADPVGSSENSAPDTDHVLSVIGVIKAMFKNNGGDCSSLFGYDASQSNPGLSPLDVLTQMAAGTHYGSIEFAAVGGDGEAVPVDATIAYDGQRFLTGPDGSYQYGQVTIRIDNSSDYTKRWFGSQETDIERAKILLHELGHAMNYLLGSGGSMFQNETKLDGTQDTQKQAYNKTLEDKCIH